MIKSLILLSIISAIKLVHSQCTTYATLVAGTCLCNQGYYGIYADESNGACTPCPTGTTTDSPSSGPTGNTSSSTNISVCNQCTINYFMNTAADTSSTSPTAAECVICPNGSGNIQRSLTPGDVSQCNICIESYYMTAAAVVADNTTTASAATCINCPIGSSSPGASNVGDQSQCTTCQINFYMTSPASPSIAAECQVCPAGTGNLIGPTTVGDVSQCSACLANQFMTALAEAGDEQQGIAATSAQCSACPSYSYISIQTEVGSISSCTCFDSNAAPLSASVQCCTCKNGYEGSVSMIQGTTTGCSKCASSYFSTNGSKCTTCALGSSISSDQGSCNCNDTSTGTTAWDSSTNVCQCQANYYGDPSTATAGTTNSCTSCPNGEISQQGSLSEADCTSDYISTTNSSILTFSFYSSFLLLLISYSLTLRF